MRLKFFRVLCALWLFIKSAFYSVVFGYVLISICMLIERWCQVSPGIFIGILLAAIALLVVRMFISWPEAMLKAQNATLMSNQQIKDRITLCVVAVVVFGAYLLICHLLYCGWLALQ